MLVRRISPAPRSTPSRAHSTASRPAGGRPPATTTPPPPAPPPPPRPPPRRAPRGGPPAGDHPLPRPVVAPLGVDRQHHALRAEHVGHLADELGPGDRRAVDADLVRARVEHALRVADRPDPAPDREWDEDLVAHPPRQVDHRVALVRGGGDVEEDELVRARPVVEGGELDRVARVAQLQELRALHHAPGVHVQTGDDPLEVHGCATVAADMTTSADASLWLATAPPTDYAPLDADTEVDVAVIGGGITGLTTALLLKRDGFRVAVLE